MSGGYSPVTIRVQAGRPVRLVFDRQYRFGPNLSLPHYSLSPDGTRFLFVREEPGARSLDLITNWLRTLDQR